MLSKIVSLLLISILVPGSALPVCVEASDKTPNTQNDAEKVSKLMDQALGIPTGSPVEAFRRTAGKPTQRRSRLLECRCRCYSKCGNDENRDSPTRMRSG
jgi:hypothetical protein